MAVIYRRLHTVAETVRGNGGLTGSSTDYPREADGTVTGDTFASLLVAGSLSTTALVGSFKYWHTVFKDLKAYLGTASGVSNVRDMGRTELDGQGADLSASFATGEAVLRSINLGKIPTRPSSVSSRYWHNFPILGVRFQYVFGDLPPVQVEVRMNIGYLHSSTSGAFGSQNPVLEVLLSDSLDVEGRLVAPKKAMIMGGNTTYAYGGGYNSRLGAPSFTAYSGPEGLVLAFTGYSRVRPAWEYGVNSSSTVSSGLLEGGGILVLTECLDSLAYAGGMRGIAAITSFSQEDSARWGHPYYITPWDEGFFPGAPLSRALGAVSGSEPPFMELTPVYAYKPGVTYGHVYFPNLVYKTRKALSDAPAMQGAEVVTTEGTRYFIDLEFFSYPVTSDNKTADLFLLNSLVLALEVGDAVVTNNS